MKIEDLMKWFYKEEDRMNYYQNFMNIAEKTGIKVSAETGMLFTYIGYMAR